MTTTSDRLCPPHARWCAWVHDEVLAKEQGLFPIFEHACNCSYRTMWEGVPDPSVYVRRSVAGSNPVGLS